jgi:hypothetical protein
LAYTNFPKPPRQMVGVFESVDNLFARDSYLCIPTGWNGNSIRHPLERAGERSERQLPRARVARLLSHVKHLQARVLALQRLQPPRGAEQRKQGAI